MSMERLTSTSYLVLGLLAREGPSTPYALERHVQATLGNFWTFPHTLLYSEPPRLAAMGLVVEARETRGQASARLRDHAGRRVGARRRGSTGRPGRRRSCVTWGCSSCSSRTSRRPSRDCTSPSSSSRSTRRSWPPTRRTSASSDARIGRLASGRSSAGAARRCGWACSTSKRPSSSGREPWRARGQRSKQQTSQRRRRSRISRLIRAPGAGR